MALRWMRKVKSVVPAEPSALRASRAVMRRTGKSSLMTVPMALAVPMVALAVLAVAMAEAWLLLELGVMRQSPPCHF